MELIVSIVFLVVLMIATFIICILSAHKEEIWEEIYDRYIEK